MTVLVRAITYATHDGTRKEYLARMTAVPLFVVDDLDMRKLLPSPAEDLRELVMRRYERAPSRCSFFRRLSNHAPA